MANGGEPREPGAGDGPARLGRWEARGSRRDACGSRRDVHYSAPDFSDPDFPALTPDEIGPAPDDALAASNERGGDTRAPWVAGGASEARAAERVGEHVTAFLGVLADCGVELSHPELLDALWLARRMPTDATAPVLQALADAFASGGSTSGTQQPGTTEPSASEVDGPGEPEEIEAAELLGPIASPPPRVREAPPSAAARLYAAPEPARATPTNPPVPAVQPLRVPERKALRDELRISRAMRPLKQHRLSSTRGEFDADATVTALAETGLPDVALRPARERWLDLALVIDDGMSMLLWQRLATELRALVQRVGAFRVVRTYGLHTDGPSGVPGLRGRPFDATAPTAPTGSLTDLSGQTLVLVLSDGMGPSWRDGRKHAAVLRWARHGPTAIVHALPPRLWDGSGIRADRWRVTTQQRGAANADWTVADPVLPPSLASFDGVPVPVLEPAAAPVSDWARLVASPGGSTLLPLLRPAAPAVLVAPAPAPTPRPREPGPESTADGIRRVQRFKDAASPEAYRLAAHLAAIAPVSVPVMRLVQAAVPWRADTAQLAEVFLGGLLRPADAPYGSHGGGCGASGLPPQHRVFDFTRATVDVLLDAVPAAELLDTGRHIGQLLGELAGRSPDFPAWLAHPRGVDTAPAGARAFAEVGPRLAARFGAPALPVTDAPAPPTPDAPPPSGPAETEQEPDQGSQGIQDSRDSQDSQGPEQQPGPDAARASTPSPLRATAETGTEPPAVPSQPVDEQWPIKAGAYCPQCGSYTRHADFSCDHCGHNLYDPDYNGADAVLRCAYCSALSLSDARFCIDCGLLLPGSAHGQDPREGPRDAGGSSQPPSHWPQLAPAGGTLLNTFPPPGAAAPNTADRPLPGNPFNWPPLRPYDPTQLGPYTLVGRISASLDRVLYLGRHQQTGTYACLRTTSGAIRGTEPEQRTAPKVLRAQAQRLRMEANTLHTEADALRRMAGRYAPQLLDTELGGAQPWLACELLRGPNGGLARSLASLLADGTDLAWDALTAASVACQVADAVALCGAQGVEHPTLSTDTVLLAGDAVKLAGWPSVSLHDMHMRGSLPGGVAEDSVYTLGTILLALGGGERTLALEATRDGSQERWVGSRWWQGPYWEPVRNLVMQCLSPDPGSRPTARYVAEFIGRYVSPAPNPARTAGDDAPTAAPPAPAPTAPPPPYEAPPTATTQSAAAWAAPHAHDLDPLLRRRGLRTMLPGGKAAAAQRETWLSRIRTPLPKCHRIAVLGAEFGAGTATTVLALGGVFAAARTDQIIAVDAGPGGSHVTGRLRWANPRGISEVLGVEPGARMAAEIASCLSPGPSGLKVLTQGAEPAASVLGDFPAAYSALIQRLTPHYALTLTNAGQHRPDALHELGLRTSVDQLIVVSTTTGVGCAQTADLYAALRDEGFASLAQNSITVLWDNLRVPRRQRLPIVQAKAQLEGPCRAVLTVPHDAHLAARGEMRLSLLDTKTLDAYLRLAATVAEGFPAGPAQGQAP